MTARPHLDWSFELTTDSGTYGIGALVTQWAGEVLAIRDDVARHEEGLYTADDYDGALHARGLLFDALKRAAPSPTREAPAVVEAIDELFRRLTEEVPAIRPADWAFRVDPGAEEWWWLRVPVAGPARREIEQRAGLR